MKSLIIHIAKPDIAPTLDLGLREKRPCFQKLDKCKNITWCKDYLIFMAYVRKTPNTTLLNYTQSMTISWFVKHDLFFPLLLKKNQMPCLFYNVMSQNKIQIILISENDQGWSYKIFIILRSTCSFYDCALKILKIAARCSLKEGTNFPLK